MTNRHLFFETRKKSCILRKWELEKNNFSSKGNNVENIKTNKLFNEHNLPSSINKENYTFLGDWKKYYKEIVIFIEYKKA